MRIWKDHKGQSLVEFALILPILLILVLGAMDIGRLFFTKTVITNAAREGANHLAYHPADIAGMQAVIAQEANSSTLEYADLNITTDPITGCCLTGQPVTVTVSTTVDLIYEDILALLGMISGPIELSSSVEMMVLK